jgi:hypothetical protein
VGVCSAAGRLGREPEKDDLMCQTEITAAAAVKAVAAGSASRGARAATEEAQARVRLVFMCIGEGPFLYALFLPDARLLRVIGCRDTVNQMPISNRDLFPILLIDVLLRKESSPRSHHSDEMPPAARTSHSPHSNDDDDEHDHAGTGIHSRSRNARAQARHRAKRKAYIENVRTCRNCNSRN